MKSTIVLILLFFPAWACAGTVQEIKQLDLSKNVFINETISGELNIERVKGKITTRE